MKNAKTSRRQLPILAEAAGLLGDTRPRAEPVPSPDQDSFILQDFLPFLTARAGVMTGLVFSEDLREFDLTLFEWRVLASLWGCDGLRLKEIAGMIVADLSTTSRHVMTLQKNGLIKRTGDRNDKRAICLTLTTKGERLIAKIIPTSHLHERVATKGLAAADLVVLRRCLVTIFNNLIAFEVERQVSQEKKRPR